MEKFEVILVQFPFTNLEQNKQRPALVLNKTPYSEKLELITLAMITSKLDGPRIVGDYEIKDWKGAGLLHPSLLRLAKIATLENSLVIKTLGFLSETDQKKVKNAFKEQFKKLFN
jgi:mRNA interferase MazF